jgi:pyridoxine 5'-phosphate synthase PdxJ
MPILFNPCPVHSSLYSGIKNSLFWQEKGKELNPSPCHGGCVVDTHTGKYARNPDEFIFI